MRLSIENRLRDDKKLWREKGRIKRLKSLSKKQGIHASGKTFRILINKWLENIKKICNWKKYNYIQNRLLAIYPLKAEQFYIQKFNFYFLKFYSF
jgi:hypothetical protein